MIIELMNIVLAARETSSENALCKLGVRFSNSPSSRRIPNRRCIGSFLMDQFDLLRNLCAQANLVIQHPARRRYLDHARIVEGFLLGIEIRIGPDCGEFGSADGVCPVRGFQVNCVADRCFAAAVLAYLAAVRNSYIINVLLGLAFFIQPSLDDLHAVEICADGVTQGIDHEGRRLAFGRLAQISAHGYALSHSL